MTRKFERAVDRAAISDYNFFFFGKAITHTHITNVCVYICIFSRSDLTIKKKKTNPTP